MDIKKGFQTYFVSAFRQYFDFKGRTGKKAYWMFVLYSMVIGWAVIALDNILGTEEIEFITLWGIHYGMFYNFYSLVILVPGLAIAVRRLHDVGKKGSSLFMVLIPIYGLIWLIIHLVKDGDPNRNEYGPVPPEEPQPDVHPYAPNKEKDVETFDVASLRKEAEENVAMQVKQSREKKKDTAHKPKKKKNKKKFSLLDRGAVDFTYHSKEKRKT